jgi:hypothetical protein
MEGMGKRITVSGQPQAKLHETKKAGVVDQMVEPFPSKPEALSSDTSKIV